MNECDEIWYCLKYFIITGHTHDYTVNAELDDIINAFLSKHKVNDVTESEEYLNIISDKLILRIYINQNENKIWDNFAYKVSILKYVDDEMDEKIYSHSEDRPSYRTLLKLKKFYDIIVKNKIDKRKNEIEAIINKINSL